MAGGGCVLVVALIVPLTVSVPSEEVEVPAVVGDGVDDVEDVDDVRSLSRASNDGRGISCSWLPKETWVIPTVLRVATIPRPPSIEDNVDGERKSPARTTAEGRRLVRYGDDEVDDDEDDDDDDDSVDRKVCKRGRFASSYTSLMATIRSRANAVVPVRGKDVTDMCM